MQFLLNKLTKVESLASGVEVYRNASGDKTIHVDNQAGRAVIRFGEREAVLVRNDEGLWVPENNNWRDLAQVLDAPALANATSGF